MKTLIESLDGQLEVGTLKVVLPKLKRLYLKQQRCQVEAQLAGMELKEMNARYIKIKKDLEVLRSSLEKEKIKAFDFISPWEEEEESETPEDKEKPEVVEEGVASIGDEVEQLAQKAAAEKAERAEKLAEKAAEKEDKE